MSLYSTLLERVVLPVYYTARGRDYPRRRAFLEQSQWWTPDRLREFQWQETRALLEHAFATVPYYRDKYTAAGIAPGDIRSLEDFSRLPSLTREEVNVHGDRLRSSAYTGKLLPHATGGSSGVPTRFYITIESYDWRYAATQRAYSWTGCTLGERSLYLWGAPVGKVPRLKALKLSAYRASQRQLVFSTFSQTEELWTRIHRAALDFRPVLLVGYVSSIEQFARFLLERKLSLPGIKAVVAAAEPVFAPFRELVQRALGCPVFNTYGSREFMSIGGECDQHSGVHLNAENILVETRLPGATAGSELLITDLHNYGMPFLRYEIGDVGILDPTPCACGRGLPRLGAIEGRVLDVLRTSDGRVVPGELFPHLHKDIPEIKEFQVEQLSPAHIVISTVLSAEMSERSRSLIASEVGKVMGAATRVELKQVDAIPRRPSGKRRVTIGMGG